MAGIIRRMTEAARRAADQQDAVDEAMKPRGCPDCGQTFGSAGAFTVHRSGDWPGGCMPPGALGQLQERDGVWVIPGSDAARR